METLTYCFFRLCTAYLELFCQVRDQEDQPEFLYPVLVDGPLHSLLNLYDQISTTPYRPFRPYPPADGSAKLSDALASIDAFFEQEDLADIAELSTILNQCHFRALIQVQSSFQ